MCWGLWKAFDNEWVWPLGLVSSVLKTKTKNEVISHIQKVKSTCIYSDGIGYWNVY